MERGRVRQERRDILEEDARFGKIGNITDILGQIHTISFFAEGDARIQPAKGSGNHAAQHTTGPKLGH
jgi:hypothetical protein